VDFRFHLKVLFVALAALAVTAGGAVACDLLWQVGSPMPTGNLINRVAYGNSTFVGVGGGGDVETSADGLTWVKQCSPSAVGFSDIVFGNSRFMAISGSRGAFMVHVSRDGVQWQSLSLDGDEGKVHFEHIVSAGGRFFGMDIYRYRMYVSSDGLNWIVFNTGQTLIEDVCYGQGLYVAADLGGNYFTSPDALTWTAHIFPYPGQYVRVVYGGGTFVAVAYSTASPLILYSRDGAAWTLARYTPNVPANCTALYGDGKFLLLEGGTGMWSEDGTSWTNFDLGGTYLFGEIWTGTLFMGFGSQGGPMRSTNGLVWENLGSENLISVMQVIASESPKEFVAAGGPTVATSPDGRSWTTHDIPYPGSVLALASGGGRLVGVGSGGSIFTSDDGTNWRDVSLHINGALWSVSYGAGLFVAAGDDGVMYTSHDGGTWTQRDTGSRQTVNEVVFGNGRFVVLGRNGTLLASADGLTWTNLGTGGLEYYSAAFGNGVFVIATSGNYVLVGPDELHWQQVPILGPVSSLVFAGGYFFRNKNGALGSSTDGMHWTDSPSTLGHISAGPASDGHIFVASSSALLWATTCFPSVTAIDHDTLPVEGGMHLVLTGDQLASATEVRVGGLPCPSFTVVSETQIEAVSPPHDAGVVYVTVTTPGGTSLGTSATAVVVGTRPGITSASKLSSPYRLKIQGSGFGSDSVVFVNGVSVPKTTYKSGGLLLAQGGAILKVMLPKGKPAQLIILNTATGVPSYAFAFTP
jgi:trimeric autotransporter adhesin